MQQKFPLDVAKKERFLNVFYLNAAENFLLEPKGRGKEGALGPPLL